MTTRPAGTPARRADAPVDEDERARRDRRGQRLLLDATDDDIIRDHVDTHIQR